MESGSMVDSTDVANTYQLEVSSEKGFGKMEKERSGWMSE
jgi:hypothetical protein